MWTKDTAITIRLVINTTKLYLLHTLLGVSHRETGDRGEEETAWTNGWKDPKTLLKWGYRKPPAGS